jgi:hypothetical protein
VLPRARVDLVFPDMVPPARLRVREQRT